MTAKKTSILSLEKKLHSRFPTARLSLDRPAVPSGTWFLDITLNGHFVIVQWKKDQGFGVSCTSDPGYGERDRGYGERERGYGERPDEFYVDEEATYGRIVSLLLSKNHTAPPEAVRLGELRKRRGVSQMELADRLSIQQGAVSKFERRQDMLVSTIRDVVRCMGGDLQIIAKFPNGVEHLLEFGDEVAIAKKSKAAKTTKSVIE
jgi:hypothetical protein